eukprot:4809900-Heterocapsa_arctica.AAC.1
MGFHIVIFIDNTAALGAVNKGRSSAKDIDEVAFDIYCLAKKYSFTLSANWVLSTLNISDHPSRGKEPVR